MAQNPYIDTAPRTTDARAQKADVVDGAIAATKMAKVAWGVPGLAFSMGRGLISAPFGGSAANQFGNAAGKMFNIGGVGAAVGAAVAIGRGIQGIGEFAKGNHAGGIAKMTRALVEGGLTALNVTGFLIVPELATKLFTGKFLSTHLGEMTENVTAATINGTSNLMGSAGAKIGATVTAGTVATAAVMKNGLKFGQGKETLYAGRAVPGIGRVHAQEAAPVEQVAQPAPGMGTHDWRNAMAARGVGPRGISPEQIQAQRFAQPAFAGAQV